MKTERKHFWVLLLLFVVVMFTRIKPGSCTVVVPKVVLDTAGLILPSIKGRSRTLSCSVQGEPAPDIQWFNNGKKINGATQSTLQVQFISAEDVMTNYNCTRADSNTRAVVCNTFYTCRATFPNVGMAEAVGQMTVNLNIPVPPVFRYAAKKKSITLSWKKTTQTDDVGQITWYGIEFNNQSSNHYYYVRQSLSASYKLAYLKPGTKYSVRMSAMSRVGHGLWSSPQIMRTSIATPSCSPTLLTARATSSTSIVITWTSLSGNQKCLNGVLRQYKVIYRKTSGGLTKSIKVSKSDSSKEISGLGKYTRYEFKVLACTVSDGPLSNAIQETTLQDAPTAPVNPKVVLLSPQCDISVPRILVTWEKPQQENGIIKRYDIDFIYELGKQTSNTTRIRVTDIDRLSYTTSVLGETGLRLKIRASTIRDGPYTSYISSIVPAYPPAIAPRDTRVTKINATTFKIAWQPLPRNQSNGFITKYEVTWQRMRVRKRSSSSGQSVTASTQGSQYIIYNLRACALYRVYVKGFTKAGPGPRSTVQFLTSPPGEPTGVRAVKRTITSIELSWDKPPTRSQVIAEKYAIEVKATKKYLPQYTFSKSYIQIGEQTNLVIKDLRPGTSYEFRLTATSKCGHSRRSVTLTARTKISTRYSNSTIWALKGDEVTIGCHTSGYEPIKYTWTKPGSLSQDSFVGNASGDDLVVRLQSDKDFGTYICNVTDSERTVVYTINRVELKKYSFSCSRNTSQPCASLKKESKTVVPYVIPLALIILGLIICIVYLVYRLRKAKQLNDIFKKMDDRTNDVIDAINHTGVRNDVMDANHSRDTGVRNDVRGGNHPRDAGVRNDVTDINLIGDVTKNSTETGSAKVETPEVETPTYIEIIPSEDIGTIYESMEAESNHDSEGAAPHTQGMMGDIQPRDTGVRNDVMDAIHPRDTGRDTGVRNDVTDTNLIGDVTKNSTETGSAKVETPTYIEIIPSEDIGTIYESMEAESNHGSEGATPHTQGMMGDIQYMELKPRINTEYEALHYEKNAPGQDYEIM